MNLHNIWRKHFIFLYIGKTLPVSRRFKVSIVNLALEEKEILDNLLPVFNYKRKFWGNFPVLVHTLLKDQSWKAERVCVILQFISLAMVGNSLGNHLAWACQDRSRIIEIQ